MPRDESRNESRKRPYSELQDTYAGPEDFMEAGVRGFLVTSVPDQEEQALDQALRMLRKACVKLYGGIQPIKHTTAMFSIGYIALDFMDPDSVTVLPDPDAKTQDTKQEQENTSAEKENDDAVQEAGDSENKETTLKEEAKEEKMVEGETEEKEHDEEMEEDDTKGETSINADQEDTDEAKGKNAKEAGDGDQKSDDKKKENTEKAEKSKDDSEKSKLGDDKDKKGRTYKTRREKKATPKWPIMKTLQKFKAFRTEFRNVLFIKSDVPDPLVVTTEVMNLILQRKPLRADAIHQLLPIQGICNYDYRELEIMSRRVLAPFFWEGMEEDPSFGVLMFDKFSDPGADILVETVRSAIWSLNPMAWQNSPLLEPDVTIQIELIGSKIVLSAMSNYMKYRQYTPFCLAELGEGEPDDPENQDKRSSDRGRSDSRWSDRKGRSRSRGEKPRKRDDISSSRDKDTSSSRDKDASFSRDKDTSSSRDKDRKSDSRKSKREKTEDGKDSDGEKSHKSDTEIMILGEEKGSKKSEQDVIVIDEEEESKKEKKEDKAKEKEEAKVEEETEENNEETDLKKEEDDKKTPQRRSGRRAPTKKKKN